VTCPFCRCEIRSTEQVVVDPFHKDGNKDAEEDITATLPATLSTAIHPVPAAASALPDSAPKYSNTFDDDDSGNFEVSMVHSLFGVSHTHARGTTRVSRYQKGKTNLDFTEARDSEWQWHQLGRTQVCTELQTDNHASTPPLSFLQAGCPSCHPTNSVKALKVATVSRFSN